jgi:dTMP kinase
VLCDRFGDATIAYQGYGRGLPVARIDSLQSAAGIDRQPDLTLLFDLDVGPALARIRTRGGPETQSRFDRETEAFHRRVRDGYLRIAAAEPDRIRRVDADVNPDQVAAQVRRIVDDFLQLETAA